jgi:cation-transporting ATPase 13A1
VSIGRPTGPGAEERTVPGDLLLLAGTAIANEALLTGESTPQWKTPIFDEDPSQRLSIKRDKVHVLFGGTKILQHTGDKSAPVRTPDGGCMAVVLRTGFDTSQGKLMRTILFSQVWRSTSFPFLSGISRTVLLLKCREFALA